MHLILASTSKYRKALLARVGIEADTMRPNYDELPFAGRSPRELVRMHGHGKALAVVEELAARQAQDELVDTYVIGSDQGLIFEDKLVGKPGSVENAVAQLMAFQKRSCDLVTSLCVINAATRHEWNHLDTTTLCFADLTEAEIRNYVDYDMPLDCAGSFKIESRGPELFEAIHTKDPTAIEGLPLMALCAILRDIRIKTFE